MMRGLDLENAEPTCVANSARNRAPRESNHATRPRIKKIPPELRRLRINFSLERNLVKRFFWRLREDSQFLRSTVQVLFALLCIWIGVEFFLFMKWGLSAGQEAFYPRPPGVEGFLPISALISLKYWLYTGIINNIHPAALFILLGIVAMSVLLKKSFCSWMCPIGTMSESLWLFGQKLFGKNIQMTGWLDYPLRSLKYLLLFFFIWSIWQMDVESLEAFINSPYNKVADVKMYQFFADISTFALLTIIILVVLSVVVKNFWCRFLCPYGALLGIIGWLSPLKVTRQKSTCIDCELCTKECPANIKVHKAGRVWSDECTSCLLCVQVCPVKNTLDVRDSANSRPIPGWVLGTLAVGMFIAITGFAMLTGNWRNGISKEEYQRRFQQLNSPVYQHFRGEVPQYGPKD